jgi:CBS domain-containing protein
MSTMHRTLVQDLMTQAVVSAHPDAVFKEIAAAMARNNVSNIPVLDAARRVVGVVSAADLLARVSGDRGEVPRGHRLGAAREQRRKVHAATAADLMTSPAVTVAASETAREAAKIAAHFHVRSMPVVDDSGALVGMISRSDLLKPFLREDGSIRHEIEEDIIRVEMLLDPLAVKVAVSEGTVTLTGFVEHRSTFEQLAENVRHIDAVVELENKISYRIDDTVRPTPRAFSV